MSNTDFSSTADASLESYEGDFTTQASLLNDQFFTDLLRVLKPKGTIKVTVPSTNKSVKRNLLFSGFVDIKSEVVDTSLVLTAAKPDQVAATTIKVNEPATTTGEWGWGVDTTKEGELISESSLLNDDTKSAPTFDCGDGSGARKACKNCTCGLAQQEQEAAENNQPAPVGGCGSCALGDAYRCATCPSLGKPAWKTADDKVKLDL